MIRRGVIVLGLLGLLGLLTGCHPLHIMDGPDMEYQGDDNVPAEDSEPGLPAGFNPFDIMDGPDMEHQGEDNVEDPKPETDKPVTGKDEEGSENAAAYLLSDYLSVERTETPCGLIEMPALELEKLPGDDARLADQMFRALRDRLVSLAEACQNEAEASGEPLEMDGPVCETRVCLSDDILSMLIRYQEPDYYAPAMTLHEAVSLNVKTGEAVPPKELLALAGYDTQEANAILRAYAEDCMTSQWRAMASWSSANGEAMPDVWGETDLGWQDVLDEMLTSVWMEPQPLGEPWDTLERSPAMFYEGGDRLSVCAPIPTLAGAGFTETMVNLGHGADAIHDRNPLDCFGEPFDSESPLTE